MSGYSKEELTRMNVTDINPSTIFIDWPKFWQRLKNQGKIVLESKHQHKLGHLYDIEITGNFIELDGQEFSCSIVRDIRQRKFEEVEKEHILDILKKANWKVSGEKGAVKILRLNATTLEAKMKKLGIVRE